MQKYIIMCDRNIINRKTFDNYKEANNYFKQCKKYYNEVSFIISDDKCNEEIIETYRK